MRPSTSRPPAPRIPALGLLVWALLLSAASNAVAQDAAVDRLVAAYPDFLAGHADGMLIWKDGARMPLSDGRANKSFDEKLRAASLRDQLELSYPKGPLLTAPARQDDPGRFRNKAFFVKMYGDCQRRGVSGRLARLAWMPKSGGGAVEVTTINGVAQKLEQISAELDQMAPNIRIVAAPSAGAYNCRTVQDAGQPSLHAFGAAIDLNVKFADYWLWRPNGDYRNRIPQAIVEIFERHGFIWGGKWGHFDTMHFEYRPELL